MCNRWLLAQTGHVIKLFILVALKTTYVKHEVHCGNVWFVNLTSASEMVSHVLLDEINGYSVEYCLVFRTFMITYIAHMEYADTNLHASI